MKIKGNLRIQDIILNAEQQIDAELVEQYGDEHVPEDYGPDEIEIFSDMAWWQAFQWLPNHSARYYEILSEELNGQFTAEELNTIGHFIRLGAAGKLGGSKPMSLEKKIEVVGKI